MVQGTDAAIVIGIALVVLVGFLLFFRWQRSRGELPHRRVRGAAPAWASVEQEIGEERVINMGRVVADAPPRRPLRIQLSWILMLLAVIAVFAGGVFLKTEVIVNITLAGVALLPYALSIWLLARARRYRAAARWFDARRRYYRTAQPQVKHAHEGR